MSTTKPRSLILACGNTLRSDDGVGPFLADWAEQRFRSESSVQVIARQQWTPDLAQDVAAATSVLFLDCSVETIAGAVQLRSVAPDPGTEPLATHHIGAAELLALSRDLYNAVPARALLLTIGAASIELGETFSAAVQDAVPQAQQLIEETLCAWLGR